MVRSTCEPTGVLGVYIVMDLYKGAEISAAVGILSSFSWSVRCAVMHPNSRGMVLSLHFEQYDAEKKSEADNSFGSSWGSNTSSLENV